MTGYTPQQFDSGEITFFSLIPPEDHDEYMEKVAESQKSGGGTLEHRVLCADGSRINVICIGNDYISDEGHKCVSIALSNITDRVQLEKSYNRTKNEVDALIENMIGGIVVIKLKAGHTEIVKASNDYFKIIGAEDNDIKSLKDLLTPADKELLWGMMSECAKDHKPFEATVKLMPKNNKRRWIKLSGRYFDIDTDGCDMLYCSIIDVTERKKAEKKLEKQSLCFKMFSENSEQLFFDYDVEEDEFSIIADKTHFDTEGNVISNFLAGNYAEKTTHPDDIDIFRKVWSDALSSPSNGTADYRTNAFDDSYRWYRINYVSTGDESGIKSVYGMMTCIDHMKVMKSRIAQDKKVIEKLSTTDPVTLLYNRAAFITFCTQMLKDMYNPDECFAIVYSDINDFSYVNENFGYEAGNKMLFDFAEVIRNCSITIIGCRIYSDYFVSLYHAPDREALIDSIAERNKTFTDLQKEKYPSSDIKISAGIYFIHSADEDITIAIDNANLARRSVKGSSDVPSGIYTDRMRLKRSHDQTIASEIWNAINTGAIELFLQPKFDMETRKIIGAEALSRWRNPDGSYKMPYEFIDVLENIGHITHLDFYMYEQVLKHLAKWKSEGKPLFPISINFSRKHNNNPDFVDRINRLAEHYGVDKSLIEVEITESSFTQDVKNLFANMKRLRDYGFKVDIDDFGTGYSSLSVLMNAPVDIVKVDKVFIDDIVENELARDYVNHICRLIKSTKKDIIFEGVENEQQAEILTNGGNKMAQGWLFDKAIPVEEFEKKYL